jgi:hypothetical protein
MIVYKSAMVESLDDFFGGRPAWCEWAARKKRRAAQKHALELLQDTQRTLPDVVRQLVVDKSGPGDVGSGDDLEAWLNKPSQPSGTPAETVMRRGYTEALLLARDTARPIETFWVTGVATEELEIQLCDSDRQVTVLVFLPYDRPYGSDRARSKTSVVRASELRQHSGPRSAG